MGLRRTGSRSGAVWGSCLGLYIGGQALAYASAYKTPAEREKLASSVVSSTTDALVGPARGVDTVAGYTAWKCLIVVAVMAAIWGLLTSTRFLRGEEDSGRMELLLGGPTTRRQTTVSLLSSLGLGLLALFSTAGVVMVALGRSRQASLPASSMVFFASVVALAGGSFLAVGALTSQLASRRRSAAGSAAALLGVAFALRMVADSVPGLSWLTWTSPLGWAENARPLTGSRFLPVVLLAVFTAVVTAAALILASRRDLGEGLLHSAAGGVPSGPLPSPLALSLRLSRGVLAAWGLGVVAMAALLGSESKVAAKAFADSPSATRVLARLGGVGAAARAYIGLSFVMIALMAALVVAGQLTSIRQEESSGRLEHILSRPQSRSRWLVGRFALSAAAALVVGLLAGVVTWGSSASAHLGVSLASFVGAGLNAVPPALTLAGTGLAVFGWRPRLASAAVYTLIAWSFLATSLGGVLGGTGWLVDLSLFHYMRPAPAQAPDLISAFAMVGLGLVLAGAGVILFRRRDLASD